MNGPKSCGRLLVAALFIFHRLYENRCFYSATCNKVTEDCIIETVIRKCLRDETG